MLRLFPVFFFCVFFSCKKDPAFPKIDFIRTDSATSTPPIPLNDSCVGTACFFNKRYDEAVFVTTHNAFNADKGDPVNYLFPNQDYRISKQLMDGVRGLMIDVHPGNSADSTGFIKPLVYHGFSWTGSEPFENVLIEIRQFLDSNPTEIVTIILECYVTSAEISASMQNSGLTKYLFSHQKGTSWETLKSMIESNKRLVVFSDVNDAGTYSWYHYLWDYCVETGYSAHNKEDLNCNYNRGDSANSLFILNHFITQTMLGTGQPTIAEEINSNPFLINKAKECMNLHGKLPNFLTVDFYSRGNVFDAAKELNGLK